MDPLSGLITEEPKDTRKPSERFAPRDFGVPGWSETIKDLLSKAAKDSVMEPGFISSLTGPKESPIDYENLGSTIGGRIRQMFVDPVKNYAEAVDKGMTGQQLSIKDLLALTEVNLDLAAGGGFTRGLTKGVDMNTVSSFPAWHGSQHNISIAEGFKDKAIGTGEGAQYFGHGHYQSGSRGVAKTYPAQHNTTFNYKGKALSSTDNPETPEEWLHGYIKDDAPRNKKELKETLSTLKESLTQDIKDMSKGEMSNYDFNDPDLMEMLPGYETWPEQMLGILDNMDSKDFGFADKHLYKDTLHKGKDPSEYDYLDWHRPIGEQKATFKKLEKDGLISKFVKDQDIEARLKNLSEDELSELDVDLYYKGKFVDPKDPTIMKHDIFNGETLNRAEIEHIAKQYVGVAKKQQVTNEDMVEWITDLVDGDLGSPEDEIAAAYLKTLDFNDFKIQLPTTGEQLYKFLEKELGSDVAASAHLKSLGISGNVFDAGTLSGGTKSRAKNYVTFDPKEITIEQHWLNDKPYEGIFRSKPEVDKEGFQTKFNSEAKKEGKTIGRADFSVYKGEEPTVNIEMIRVNNEELGKGYGKALVDDIIEQAKKSKATTITGESISESLRGILDKKLGKPKIYGDQDYLKKGIEGVDVEYRLK
jgi:predicted GNAT family acetyltransferase